MTDNIPTDEQFIGENGPMSPEDCALWLDAKYRRHHELEDRASAQLIRWQDAEIKRLRKQLYDRAAEDSSRCCYD